MGYQTLYRKYRPQRFADLVGQDHVTSTLQNALRSGRLAHAYLFCGPRGTGKTTTARILAKALNCERLRAERTASPELAAERFEPCNECPSCQDITRGVSFDVSEVDAASNRGIDDIRQLTERAQQAATDPSRHSVFIIDEVHQLSRDGASAFLKTLEEPPPNVVFVLATTDPEKMIPTILSRCQRFDFRPVPVAALAACLREVCTAEGIHVAPGALEAMARRSRGGVRDALSALEQARALCDDHIETGDVVALFGGLDTEDVAAVFDAVADADAGAALRRVDALVLRGIDVRTYLRELVDWARWVFLAAAAPGARDLIDLGEEACTRAEGQAARLGPAKATRALTLLGQAMSKLPASLHPRIELEAALVALAHPGADSSPEGLAARVEALERVAAAPTAGDSRPGTAEPPAAPPPESREGPVAPAEEPPVPATASGASDPDAVVARWSEVVDTIKRRSPRSGAYFLGSAPTSVAGDVIRASFAAEFHREHAVKSCQEVFGDATEAVFGVRFRIDGDGGVAQATPARPEAEEPVDEDHPEDASASGPSGGAPVNPLESVVDLITTELGGEIVTDAEQPRA